MRIGVDATALPPRLFGAGNYIVNLVRQLPRVDAANEYWVFVKPEQAHLFQEQARLHVVTIALPLRMLRVAWEQAGIPALVRRYQLDLFHSPHYTQPFLAPCRRVVTVHDMTFFLFPEVHKTYKRVFFKSMIILGARYADRLIADSESTRRDLLRIVHVAPEKVVSVPLGVSPEFERPVPPDQLVEIRDRYHLPECFVLCVGELQPRKNLITLIRAYAQAVRRGLPHSLVIVGRQGWMYEDFYRTIHELALGQRVIFTGYVPPDDLPSVYQLADALAYPSLYEGFGFPVLEAMASRTLVIASNASSMPEITGDAGVLVDPRNVDEWTEQLWRALTDREWHAELERRGAERARLFSWERTARETAAVYSGTVT